MDGGRGYVVPPPTEYGANTPEYIYKMWGGEVPLKEIEWLSITPG